MDIRQKLYNFKNLLSPPLDQIIALLRDQLIALSRDQLIASLLSLILPLDSISQNPGLLEMTGKILANKFS